MLFVIYMCVSSLCFYPRTWQVPKTPKVDQGKGESRGEESGRLYMKASDITTSTIAESNLLESNGDIIDLKAFVCLFLITVATPHDDLMG